MTGRTHLGESIAHQPFLVAAHHQRRVAGEPTRLGGLARAVEVHHAHLEPLNVQPRLPQLRIQRWMREVLALPTRDVG